METWKWIPRVFLEAHFMSFPFPVFSPFWRENFLMGPRRKYLDSTIYFPFSPPNQTHYKKVSLPIFSKKVSFFFTLFHLQTNIPLVVEKREFKWLVCKLQFCMDARSSNKAQSNTTQLKLNFQFNWNLNQTHSTTEAQPEIPNPKCSFKPTHWNYTNTILLSLRVRKLCQIYTFKYKNYSHQSIYKHVYLHYCYNNCVFLRCYYSHANLFLIFYSSYIYIYI